VHADSQVGRLTPCITGNYPTTVTAGLQSKIAVCRDIKLCSALPCHGLVNLCAS
jgi:hypothetical protein